MAASEVRCDAAVPEVRVACGEAGASRVVPVPGGAVKRGKSGRDHERTGLDLWGEDSFLDLTPPAQHLFFVLKTNPQLSYCGAGEWHPGRIAARSRGWTADEVVLAAVELTHSPDIYLIVDEDCEEYLLRSWIKHDGLWKQPNMTVSMANDRAALASRTLRGIVVHEVRKIAAANPGVSSWERDSVRKLLAQTPIDPASVEPWKPGPKGGGNPTIDPSADPSSNPSSDPSVKGYAKGWANPRVDVACTPSPSPVHNSNSKEGYVSRERHLSAVPDPGSPPNRTCPEFGKPNHPVKCGACADARRARDDWDIAQAAVRAQAITACAMCDPNGLREVGDSLARCDHQPLEESAHA